jgi:hypothetical protein
VLLEALDAEDLGADGVLERLPGDEHAAFLRGSAGISGHPQSGPALPPLTRALAGNSHELPLAQERKVGWT